MNALVLDFDGVVNNDSSIEEMKSKIQTLDDLEVLLPIVSFTGIFAIYKLSNKIKIQVARRPSGKQYHIFIDNLPMLIENSLVLKTLDSLLVSEQLQIQETYKLNRDANNYALSLFN